MQMLHNLGLSAHPLKGGPEWSGRFINTRVACRRLFKFSFYTSRERRGRSSYIICCTPGVTFFRQTPVKSLQDVVGRAAFLRGLQWPLGLLGVEARNGWRSRSGGTATLEKALVGLTWWRTASDCIIQLGGIWQTVSLVVHSHLFTRSVSLSTYLGRC